MSTLPPKPIKASIKQRKYVNALISGKAKSKYEAMTMAGYSAPQGSNSVDKTKGVQNLMIAAMQKQGLTEDFLSTKIKQGLQARQHHFFSQDGVVTDKRTTPDQSTRHKFLQTSLELLRYIKTNGIENINVGIIQVPTSELKSSSDWVNVSNQDLTVESKTETSASIDDKTVDNNSPTV